jgi:hypothetical protein
MTPLEKQLALAIEVGVAMRKAQQRYFEERRRGHPAGPELAAARHLEGRFDHDAKAALRAFYSGEEIGR